MFLLLSSQSCQIPAFPLISTLIPTTYPLHTDVTTSGTINRDIQKQGRRDGALFRFVYTHTYATGTIPVAENLPTLYPPSIQTKPIHCYSEQRRIGTTESLPFVVFTSSISKKMLPFTLGSMKSLCHTCWRLKAINCGSSDLGWEPLTPTFLCSEFCCQHEKHQRPSQSRQRMSTIYLHPGEDNRTTWNTREKQHETHQQRSLRTAAMTGEGERSLQLPEAGFLLLLKSWTLLWSPEIERESTLEFIE